MVSATYEPPSAKLLKINAGVSAELRHTHEPGTVLEVVEAKVTVCKARDTGTMLRFRRWTAAIKKLRWRPASSIKFMNQPALQVRVYESLASLASLQPAWDDLLVELPAATTFCTLEWLSPWWSAFGNGQKLEVLGFFDSTQRLVALAPLCTIPHRVARGVKLILLQLMGDGSFDSDNLDLPVRPGYEVVFAEALLDFLGTDAIAWDFCQLNTLPGDSPAGGALVSSLKRRGWRHFTFERPNLVVNLPPSWDAYLDQLTSKNKSNLQYYSNRIHRRHKVRVYKCTEERDLATCLENLFRLHQKRWQLRGEPGSFASLARRKFYHNLSRVLLARQLLEFWLLDLDGKPAAAIFGFRYREAVFSLQEGFDPDHSTESVGVVLRGHVLRQLIEAGVRRYDFLFGQSPAKDRWAPHLRHYKDIHFARPFSRGNLYLRLSQATRDSKEWLRSHVSRRAWEAIRSVKNKLSGSRDPEPSAAPGTLSD